MNRASTAPASGDTGNYRNGEKMTMNNNSQNVYLDDFKKLVCHNLPKIPNCARPQNE